MVKWYNTCYRNEVTGEWKSCDDSCPVFGMHFKDFADVKSLIADNKEQEKDIETLRLTVAKYKAFLFNHNTLGLTLQDQISENYNARVGEFDGLYYSSYRAKAVFRTLEDMIKDGLITEIEYNFCNEMY